MIDGIIKRVRINKFLSLFMFFFISLSLFTILSLLFYYSIKSKNIFVKNISHEKQNKIEQTSSFVNKIHIKFFFEKNNNLSIKSEKIDFIQNNIRFFNSIIKQTIGDNTYKGKIKFIDFDKKNKYFNVNDEFFIQNSKNEIIKFKELHGDFNDFTSSNQPFFYRNKFLQIYGENFNFSNKNKTLSIKGKTIINVKHKKNKKTKYNIQITPNNMSVYFNEKYAVCDDILIKINNDIVIKSKNVKFSFDKNNIVYFLFKDNILITTKTTTMIAEKSLFDFKNNLLVLFKNVAIKSKKNSSKSEYYIYDINNDFAITFNVYTYLEQRERNNIYYILNELANNLDKNDKKYIKTTIKQNKQFIKQSKTDANNYIDRSKRTQITFFQ